MQLSLNHGRGCIILNVWRQDDFCFAEVDGVAKIGRASKPMSNFCNFNLHQHLSAHTVFKADSFPHVEIERFELFVNLNPPEVVKLIVVQKM